MLFRSPTISSSIVPFSSCLQSFPESGSFQMSQLFQMANVLEFQLLMGGGDLINSEFSSVELSCSAMSDCDPMDCNTPGFPVHHQLLELAQTHVTESVMSSNYLILCPPLLLLPSVFSSIKVFSNVNSLHQVAKVLELQL